MRLLKWLWPYIKPYRLTIIICFSIGFLSTVLALVPQYLSGTIVDDVIIGGNRQLLYTLVGIIFAATVIRVAFDYFMRVNLMKVSQNLLYKIRKDMYVNLGVYDVPFFDHNRTGDIMAKMTGDVQMLRHFVENTMYSIFTNLILLILALVMIFSIDWRLAIAVFIVAPFLFITNKNLSKEILPIYSSIREQFSKLNTVVQENISGNRVVKAFAKEEHEIDKFDVENEEFRIKNINAAVKWSKYMPLIEMQSGILHVFVIIFGGIMVILDQITFGQLVQFNVFLFAIVTPMRMSFSVINDLQRFQASGRKVMEFLMYDPRVKEPARPVENEIKGDVEFKNVSFFHDNQKILDNINLKVKAGMKVGIIGPTGAGKSTLVSLLNRFYDPNEGQVLIDGINIKRYPLDTLRKGVAFAFQDVFLFSDTIEGNVCYGKPDADMHMVYQAADTADASEFITKAKDGYNTIVGERGTGLSGGQKQRVSLARAILYDGRIMVFDDTTSAVDIETDEQIQEELKKHCADKTIFIIAHRISSVKDSDVIIVMDKGRIIEQGTHEQLLEKNGYYYETCLQQAGETGE